MNNNDPILNELAQAGQVSPVSPLLQTLDKYRIATNTVVSDEEFLFRMFGRPCFPRRDLTTVTGVEKCGKTFFSSMLMACCAKEQVLQVQRPPIDAEDTWQRVPLRCLWYDTEQSEQSTQDILKNRVLRLAAPTDSTCVPPCSNFDVFNVRCLHYEERLRLFETAVYKYHPDLVLLDGVRDLLADINDGVKAQEIVERLMKLAQESGCCLVCVLHQNKGAEDRNLRGWIGTELMNKAFEVYSCEKAKPENIFVVEQTHTRKYDLNGMIFFRMDAETELPMECEGPTRFSATFTYTQNNQHTGDRLPYMNREWITFDENNKPHPNREALFYEALKTGPLFYSDLQSKVMTLLNCGTQMWNNMFREMRDKGYIVRTKDHESKAVWGLSSSLTAKPQPLQADLFTAQPAVSGDSPSS